MFDQWNNRSIISANLFNPAFCGEVIRNAIAGFNLEEGNLMPFSLAFLVLPFVLHKKTRKAMPKNVRTHFHSWVEDNEHLLIDFADRTKQLIPYTKEAILFLSNHGIITFQPNGIASDKKKKVVLKGDNTEEVNEIFNKSELLGKWFKQMGNEQTVYMILKIQP